jgi:hypothetical protein
MRRVLSIGMATVAIGGLAFLAVYLFGTGPPAGPKCPPTFSEFAVAPKDGVVSVSGQASYANGTPFAQGPIEINLTFMTPGCGALPFSATADSNGRFSGDSPQKEPTCIRQGGTATARTKAGCEIEGTTQETW